jgi:hypothetical protein
MSTWRDHARPIIAETIAAAGTQDSNALRKALREAYPFGPRQYHPYKIWLDEIHRQLGTGRHTRPAPDLNRPLPLLDGLTPET